MKIDKTSIIKYAVTMLVGAGFAVTTMYSRGLFSEISPQARAMDMSDGFFVAAVILIGFGAILWIATTGFFDIFGYAVRYALHLFVPMLYKDDGKKYYEYHMEKEEKRGKPQYFILICGAVYLIAAVICYLVYNSYNA